MGYVLLGHGGSGDHGCEDYVRGLCGMLPEPPTVFSYCPQEDWHYGICRLAPVYRQQPGTVHDFPEKGDWIIQTRPSPVRQLRRRGIRPVLFYSAATCPTAGQLRLLSGYETLAVTERESFRILSDAGLKNLRLCPDPAFLVRCRKKGAFSRDTVGLCLSYPQEADPLLLRNYQRLIEYILSETPLQILLIPYCVKRRSNDLLLQQVLLRQYGNTGRIRLREDGNTRQLRSDLARCRLCVGCGGAVAAWSCGVPALCLYATGRTLGICRTLFGSCQPGVLPWQLFKTETDLTEAFRALLHREDRCRTCLEQNLHRLQSPTG